MPGMGTQTSKGFTLIETMLFLGITGLLILGMLVGAGSSLAAQRYKDSVEGFKNLLQQQYSDLSSVRNDRSNTWTCGATAIPATGGSEIRGQSDCLIVGKYLRISRDQATVHTVLARETSTVVRANDMQTMTMNYVYSADTSASSEYELDWGSQIAWPISGTDMLSPSTPRNLGVLFVRSPLTGQIYTFTSNTIPPDVSSIVSATMTSMMVTGASVPGQAGRTICIDGANAFAGENMAVYIAPYAASSTAIETRSNNTMNTLGVTSRC